MITMCFWGLPNIDGTDDQMFLSKSKTRYSCCHESEQLQKRGVGFRLINDGGIDTKMVSGKMIFNILGTLLNLSVAP